MSAHDGWVYLDDPPQPERRRPATVPELAAHQAGCPECRDPWFANEGAGCPSSDRDSADYGAADPDTPDPSETTCRTCGRVATDHTRGRFSIYGVCPGPDMEDVS